MRKIFSILLMALCIAAFSGLDATAKLTVSKIVKTKKGYGYVVVKNTGKYGVKAGSYRLGYSQWGKRSPARGKYIPAGGKVTYGFKFPASKFSIAGAKGKGKGKGRKGYKTQYCDNPDFYVGEWYYSLSEKLGNTTSLTITANEDGTFKGFYAMGAKFDYSNNGPYDMTGSIENGKLILSSTLTTLVCSKAGNKLHVIDKHPRGNVMMMMRQ